MAKIIGQQVEVALMKESERATAEAPSTGDWIARGTVTVTPNKGVGEIDVSNGRITTRKDQRTTTFDTEIKMDLPVDRTVLAKLLMGVYGTGDVDDDNPESGVDTISFTILNTRLAPTYTISIIDGTNQYEYACGMLVNLELTFEASGIPMISATYITKQRASTSGLTASYPTTSYFASEDANVYLEDLYAQLDDATALDFIQVVFSFSRNYNEHYKLGNANFSDISALDWDMGVHIVKDFEEMTLASGDTAYAEALFEGNTNKSFRFEVIDTNTTIGVETNPSFKLEFPTVNLNSFSMNQDIKAVVGEEFDLVLLDGDESNGFSLAELISDVSSV